MACLTRSSVSRQMNQISYLATKEHGLCLLRAARIVKFCRTHEPFEKIPFLPFLLDANLYAV
jgi:hypothetical protein